MRVSRRHLFFVAPAILAVAAVIVVGLWADRPHRTSGPSKASQSWLPVRRQRLPRGP